VNRYPIWKYLIMAIALAIGLLYTIPNFFGVAPAVQVSAAKAILKVDAPLKDTVEKALTTAGIKADQVWFDGSAIRARVADVEVQKRAQEVIKAALNKDPADENYTVSLYLQSRSPQWLTSIRALPMYLGLDLRGGVHFLMQVDMKAAITKKVDSTTGDARTQMRDKNIRHSGIARVGNTIEINFRDAETRKAARIVMEDTQAEFSFEDVSAGADFKLVGSLKQDSVKKIQELALNQNITTLNKRINALGVAEPIIQQQGADRIVVQLPGVQDPTAAERILGKTATLELRMVDESAEGLAAAAGTAPVPFGAERYVERGGQGVVVKKAVMLSGDDLTDAQPGFDSQTQEPNVNLTVNSRGGRIMRDISRENIGKRMAILMFEKNKGEVLTAPVIRGELGNRFQISGRMSTTEANELALLLRAGALAAPMEIIEQRTVGPSLGAENIDKGFNSVAWGFAAIAVFMICYYLLFGMFSTVALGVNLLLLVAALSLLQATLTLPGIAAIALTLGMAIDANVLINERVREELRAGMPPQKAIEIGYDRAWATILDSNITTLIAGVALLVFGSGAVRGFAVVHCLGILTSMFSAVFFSRGLVNLWYGGRKRLAKVSIGQVWRPEGSSAVAGAVSEVAPQEAAKP
jgi:preprotein translocase subunit SecD